MMIIRQTDTFRKWERRLRDHRAKALIAARIFRLANGLSCDTKYLAGGDKGSQERDISTAKRLALEVK